MSTTDNSRFTKQLQQIGGDWIAEIRRDDRVYATSVFATRRDAERWLDGAMPKHVRYVVRWAVDPVRGYHGIGPTLDVAMDRLRKAAGTRRKRIDCDVWRCESTLPFAPSDRDHRDGEEADAYISSRDGAFCWIDCDVTRERTQGQKEQAI